MTPRELIKNAELRFSNADLYYGHGTDNALDEAFYLVMVASGLSFDCGDDELDKPLNHETLFQIENFIEQRINQRIPVAYLINKAWFAGREFYVDERVLIPRSPFAELITSQFMPWVSFNSVNSILELGTGSGCMAIACAYEFRHARIDAVDIDDKAILVANKNVTFHKLEDRVKIIKSDLFQNLGDNKYDLIISNPPYVSHEEMQTLPEEYLHEPNHALEANEDGLELVEKILKEAAQHLNDNGILVVEVGNSMQSLIQRHPELPFVWLEFENGGDGVFLLNKKDLNSG